MITYEAIDVIIIIIIIIIVSSHGFLDRPTGSFPGNRWPPIILGIHHLSYNSSFSQ